MHDTASEIGIPSVSVSDGEIPEAVAQSPLPEERRENDEFGYLTPTAVALCQQLGPLGFSFVEGRPGYGAAIGLYHFIGRQPGAYELAPKVTISLCIDGFRVAYYAKFESHLTAQTPDPIPVEGVSEAVRGFIERVQEASK